MGTDHLSAAAAAGGLIRRHTAAIAIAWAAAFLLLLAAMLAFAERGSAPSPDVATNGGFESGLVPWRADLGTELRRTTAEARSGEASAEVSARSDAPFGLHWLAAVTAPRRGERYTISAWVKGAGASVGNPVNLQVHEHGGAGMDRVLAWRGRPLRPAWARVAVSGVVQAADAESLDVYIWVQRPRVEGETFFVDDVAVARTGRADAASGTP